MTIDDLIPQYIDIASAIVLHIESPTSAGLNWERISLSVPFGQLNVCNCNQDYVLKIRLQNENLFSIVDDPDCHTTIVNARDTPGLTSDIRHIVLALFQRYHLQKELLTLHGSVVGAHSRAIVLVGASGEGKTVTSLMMCKKDAVLLSDDLSLIDVSNSSIVPLFVGGTRPVKLRLPVLEFYFPEFYERVKREGLPVHEERVDVSEFLASNYNQTNRSHELVGIVFVKISPGVQRFCSCDLIKDSQLGWAATRFWQSADFCFSLCILEGDYPLTLLRSADHIRHQWQLTRHMLRTLRIWRLFGTPEYVSEKAMEILTK